MKKILIIGINTFLLLLIVNFLIYFFPHKLINQKYITKNLADKLGFKYNVFYNNTYNRNINEIKNYTIFVGDSYVWGAGEARSDSQYSFGIAHFFKSIYPDMDFFQVGIPAGAYAFQEKMLENIVRHINNKPKKLYIFFYEGNDFYDEISFQLKTKSEIYLKNLKFNLYNYFPIFADVSMYIYHQFKRFKELFKSKSRNKISDFYSNSTVNDFKNEIFVDKKKLIVNNYIQNACANINENQTNKFKYSLTKYLETLKEKYPESEKIFVYIPSPASIYEHEKIYSVDWLKYENTNFSYNESLECHKIALKLVSEIVNNSQILFFNSTPELKKISRKKLIHGIKDINHFNYEGYRIFVKILDEI